MKQKTMFIFMVVVAAALISASASTIHAQTSKGTITGVVTDPQNQVISGAEVELKNPATNQSRTTTTNDSGLYRFDAVDLGTYDLIIRAQGFKTAESNRLAAQANRITTIDVQMEVGTQQETVNITASTGEILQTSEAVRGGNFSPVQVVSLPSSGLNPYDLGRLLPGVATAVGSGASFGNASQFSVNGQRPRGNNYLIDGTENNDISVTGPANQINNEDAVAEVSVQTGLFSAEFGRAGGGVFNIITKPGTKDYHGTLKWLYLSQVFNSLTNTEKALSQMTRDGANNTPKFPVFVENVFGGTIGGPLPLPRFGEGGASTLDRDKHFFFFGMQWDRFRQSDLRNPRVPTEAGVQTLRALFPAGTNPRVDLYLATIGNVRGVPTQSAVNVALGPGPNAAGVIVNRGNLQTALANVSVPSIFNDFQWVVRTDHNINDKHTLSIRYTDDDNLSNLQSFAVTPDFTIDFTGVSRNLLFSHTWIVNSSITNELRVSPYGLIDFQFPYASTASAAARTLPNISFAGSGGLSTIGLATNLPQFRTAKNYLLQDTMTKVWGEHTFRFGAEFLKQTAKQRPPFNERGSFAFNTATVVNPLDPTRNVTYPGFANFIDNFSGSSGSANINFGTPFYEPNLFRQSYFFQDSWKAKPNLTLTLGTRYENFGQPANNAFKFPAFAGFDPAQFLVPNKVEPDKNNFGPIFGFSYAPQWESGPAAWLLPRDRSVIRGGYQVSYDTFFNNLLSNIAADSPNNTSTTTTASSADRGSANFFPGAIPSTPRASTALDSQTSVFNPKIRNPYTQRWSLGFQRELPANFVMEASYVGTVGHKLFVSEDLNPIVTPGPPAVRRFPSLGPRRYRSSGANSNYHAAQFRFDRRFTDGFQINTSYTWSKNIDQISEVFATDSTGTSLASIPAFLGGLKLDRAVSDYHRGHRLTVAYVWDLPIFRTRNDFLGKVLGGWRINGITTFQSGAPFSILNGRDRNGDGQTIDRPDIGNPNAPHNTRAVIVAAGTCGSLLRNPDTLQCVTRNDVYVVQVAAAAGTTLNLPNASTIGRNTERSNIVENFDMSLFKTFRISENVKIEFRTEYFNVFNHPQITGVPGRDVTGTTAGRFLNYDFLSGGRRSGRIGLKIIF